MIVSFDYYCSQPPPNTLVQGACDEAGGADSDSTEISIPSYELEWSSGEGGEDAIRGIRGHQRTFTNDQGKDQGTVSLSP